MVRVELIVIIFYSAITLLQALDYECFEKRLKIHPSECCENGFLFNATLLQNCISAYSIKEFREFEGIWEHSCILECYLNETGVTTDLGGFNRNSTINQFKSNPYLSTTDIAKCIQEAIEYSNSTDSPLNPDAEFIHKIVCGSTSQRLAICLEELIYTNCPKDKMIKDSRCTIQDVLKECKMETISSDQFFGVKRIAITN